MGRLFAIVVIVLLLPFSSLTFAAPKRVALVVGIQNYTSLNGLSNPVGDAEAIAKVLEQYGFLVTFEKNLDHAAFEKAVEDFAQGSQGAEEAIVFYSGHGMSVSQDGRTVNALAASDADINCKSGQAQKVIALEDILARLAHIPKTVALFDACRNDPFPQCGAVSALRPGFQQPQIKGVQTEGVTPAHTNGTKGIGVSGTRSKADVLVAYSSNLGGAALDGEPGKHSPFADALLLELKEGANTPFRDLLERTTSRVKNATGFQTPWVVTIGGVPQMCPASTGCEYRTDVQKQSLVSTSRFRTEKATLLLRQNDKTTAMLLALESLPDATAMSKERRDWPLVPEAQVLLDKTLREGQEQRTIYLQNSGTTDRVLITGFNKEGNKLVSWSDQGGAEVWNVETGEATTWAPSELMIRPDNQYLGGSLRPDGSILRARNAEGSLGVVTVNDQVQLQELVTGRSRGRLREFPTDPIRVDFFPQGDKFFAVGADGNIIIWDAKSAKIVRRIEINADRSQARISVVKEVKIDPSGKRFLSINQDGFAGFMTLDGRPGEHGLEPHNSWQSDFSSDGKLVALASEHKVVISDVNTEKKIHEFIIQPSSVFSVRFTPDDKALAVGTDFGQIHIFGLQHKKAANAVPLDCRKTVWVPYSLLKENVQNPSLNEEVSTPEELSLTVSRFKNHEPLFKNHTGFRAEAEDGTYKHIAIDSSGEIAATKEEGYTEKNDRKAKANSQPIENIIIWDLKSVSVLGRINDGFLGRNHHFDLSADGKTLISFGDDSFAQLWDVKTLEKSYTLSEHSSTVHGACFSRDSSKVATIDQNSVNLWDVATGKKIQSWPTDFIPFYMDFNEDGDSLIVADQSAEEDAKAHVFVITESTQALVEEAKKAAARCLSLAERDKFGLPASPPEWCVKLSKPPYNTEAWRAWLRDRELGKQVSLPKAE